MELRYKREVAVGLMLVMGAAAFTFLMMWLRGKSFAKAVIVPVTFEDVAGLKEGDPVRTSGVRVGNVDQIVLESPGHVRVYLELRKGQPPREDATAKILSSDLFGARYVEYSPGVAARALARDSALSGHRMQDMSEMAEVLARKSNALLDTATATAVVVSRELRATLQNTQTLLGTLNRGASASSDQLVGALEDLRQSLQRVNLLLAQNGPAASEAVHNLRNATMHADSLTRTLAHATAQFDSILVKVNSGSGPAAAVLNDSTVVRELRSTNEALRALLTDFRENPGRYIRLRLF
jgi:phospholipid/cholesterol/gamma-HCH transport system substrate-binding protein